MKQTTLYFLLLCTTLLAAPAWSVNLSATVDRNHIGSGETLELRVSYDEQVISKPDFSALDRDFEILSQGQQNNLSIGAQRVSTTEWILRLLPKKTGKLLVPSFNLKGAVSNAIEITVAKATQASGGKNQPVYTETVIDKTSGYVQEQLLLTLRLYTSVMLTSLSADELRVKDASVIKISEAQYQKAVAGVGYNVVELKYAIFPSNSGELSIPSLRFTAVISDRKDPFSNSFFSKRGKQIHLRSESKQVTVKPKPTQYSANEWLPAKGISISQQWSRSLVDLTAGEPITRTIHITAQGLTAAQLPPLTLTPGDGYKIYPDQPQLADNLDSNGVNGTRSESVALVPSREGTITLPAIRVQWWDTVTQKQQETVLASQTIQINPAETMLAAPALPAVRAESQPPEIITAPPANSNWLVVALLVSNLILLAVALVLFILWRQAKIIVPTTVTSDTRKLAAKESALFKAVTEAARRNDSADFRDASLRWARSFWDDPSLLTLNQMISRADSNQLTEGFLALDQSLYSGHNPAEINLDALAKQLTQLRKNRPKQSSNNRENTLKPLYR